MSKVKKINDYREKMNERILNADNLVIKRFFNLDTNTYKEGAIPTRTKEMIGLAVSLGLRCDDCVKYHTQTCHEMGLNDKEFFEVISIAMLIGGSITIPHLRRAVEFWDELKKE
ncbi:MAG: carboxymuconolactone decarboxylase family protein [Bacteroidia bacterium]